MWMIRLVVGECLVWMLGQANPPSSGHATTPSWIGFVFPFLSVTKSLCVALTGLELLLDRLG